MKKMLAALFITSLFSFTNVTLANAPEIPAPELDDSSTREMPGAVIDDIKIPFDVLIYVETKYPGHAITEARKVTAEGKEAYRLRVDRDSLANDYNSIYLFYDMKWNLLDDQKMVAPPPEPVKEEPKPKTDDSREPGDKPQQQESDRQEHGEHTDNEVDENNEGPGSHDQEEEADDEDDDEEVLSDDS